ncbi:hypothetical protein GGQ80_003499 [Sphingomonas jinjuensis]|uniref:Peptidase M61 n=1 Tax=Sphingomonas jinjuensis TaxID=535907 RepID=A0A840FIQ6_9SPHN|nr:peptidase M61 [Sphingomonas jinjuensis]MBB4155574.1 hypothetical protein [Sphingomonas jinjuensis]
MLTMALAAAVSGQPAVAITLAPKPAARGQDRIATIDVTLRFDGVAAAAGEAVLGLPLVTSNVDTVATVITVQASDARGPLSLTTRDVVLPTGAARDADTGGPSRQWVASRAVAGRLTVRYTIPATASLPPRGPAPPFAFSDDGGGTSGAGHVFLLLPPGDAAYRATVDWNLSALPKGTRGASSYGVGRVMAPEPLTAGQLRMAYYMAGRGVGQWPVPARGFFAAWQGKPPFDAAGLMRWTGTLYDRYASFFGQKTPPPYGVFLRYNPINAGGGVGLYHSFVTTFGRSGGQGSDPGEIKFTLAHEMFHTFQPFIEEPAGLASSWFGEGLATFYQRRLPLRYGLIGPDDFVKDLNFHAGRYYTSAMATVPNAEVPTRFWADTRIRTLPYDRGMLYFADLDDRLRKASAGKRSLDDLMLAMLARQHGGRTTTNADWEAELRGALGEPAVADFRAFLGGTMPLPASDAFGPCFRRVAKPLRRYELGFDTAVLAEPKRIVRGLQAGSAAAAAGLRDGDEIVVPVPQDGIQGNQTQRLTLAVRREGRALSIDYLPRGETGQAWQWERVLGVSDKACAL